MGATVITRNWGRNCNIENVQKATASTLSVPPGEHLATRKLRNRTTLLSPAAELWTNVKRLQLVETHRGPSHYMYSKNLPAMQCYKSMEYETGPQAEWACGHVSPNL